MSETPIDKTMERLPALPPQASLIPTNYLDELIYARDTITQCNWKIGDITNEVFNILQADKKNIGRMELCSVVGKIVGKSGRTIRQYSDVAAFFNKATRDNYDVLTFNHFAVAMTFSTDWEMALNGFMSYLERAGSPPSIDMCRLAKAASEKSTDSLGDIMIGWAENYWNNITGQEKTANLNPSPFGALTVGQYINRVTEGVINLTKVLDNHDSYPEVKTREVSQSEMLIDQIDEKIMDLPDTTTELVRCFANNPYLAKKAIEIASLLAQTRMKISDMKKYIEALTIPEEMKRSNENGKQATAIE